MIHGYQLDFASQGYKPVAAEKADYMGSSYSKFGVHRLLSLFLKNRITDSFFLGQTRAPFPFYVASSYITPVFRLLLFAQGSAKHLLR